MNRYTLFYANGDLLEGNNKRVLIDLARKEKEPATVQDERCKGIIFENKAQRRINNQ